MLTIKRKILFSVGFIALFILIYFFPKIENYLSGKMAAEAVGGFPYQIGLTSVQIVPCVVSCYPAESCCTGGTLCSSDIPPACLHSTVSGTMAGGSGNMALFLKTAIAQVGLTPGGQLIAGGMGPTLMDSGVLASAGGCSGCAAAFNQNSKYAFLNKILETIGDFKLIIAGKLNN